MTKQGLFNEDGMLVKTEFMKLVSNGDETVDKAVCIQFIKNINFKRVINVISL